MLLFGATKLPELARGSGRALRIFKAETKGLMDDDDDGLEVSRAARDRGTPASAELEPQVEARRRTASDARHDTA